MRKRPSSLHEVLPGLPQGAGVALVRLRSLGDTLLLTPAAAALKAWRPDLRLATVVETRYAGVLAGNADCTQIVEVAPGVRGRLQALRELRRFRPALTVGLHGGSTAAAMVRASGARLRASFAGLRHGWAYNLQTPPEAPGDGRARLHTVEHVLSLLHALGLPPCTPGPLRLAVNAPVHARLQQRLRARGVEGAYVFLNTEARTTELCWPPEHFAALAAWLRREHGLASVHASAGAGTAIAGATLIPGTSVAELIALEAGAVLLIGNDGGPVHIAAALGKPVLALYSTTDIEVWHPWQTPSRWLQREPLAALAPDEVMAAAAALLRSAPASSTRP